MSQPVDQPTPIVLFLSHARTASHVLERMLSKQPNTLYGGEWFVPSRVQRRLVIQAGPLEDIDPAIPQELMRQMDDAYSQLLDFLSDAKRQGKIAFGHTQSHAMLSPKPISDHIYDRWDPAHSGGPGQWTLGAESEAHTNPTVLPDSILLQPGTIPILTFRHPMLVCDGIFRGFRTQPLFRADTKSRELMSVGGSLRWQTLMYDWYMKHGVPVGITPILLDADDYLGPEKELMMANLCSRIPGFDINSVIYSWPKTTSEELAKIPEVTKQSHQTLLASDGVMSGYDIRSRDVESEMARWTELYGQDDANWLRGRVEKAMPDYEYLRAHRLKPGDTLDNKE